MTKKLPPRPPSHQRLAIFRCINGHRAKRYPKLPSHRRYLQIPVPFRTTK
ncbi:hypothetical protein T03_14776, partial [Trichinella britovi]